MTLTVSACCPRCDKRFATAVPPEILYGCRAAAESDLQLIWELLSTREREILATFLQGMANSEIAKYLRTTEQVIKNYFSSIFEKTGMGSRLELLLFIVDRPLLRAELNTLFEGMQNGTIEFGTRYSSKRVTECVLAG